MPGMSRRLLPLLLLALPAHGFASETPWLCTEESSQRQGNTVLSCGVAVGDDENEARSKAFDNARNEFKKVCDASSDCRGHETTVLPKRTSCDEITGKTALMDTKYRCYRLLAFTIGNPIAPATGVPVLFDNPDNFQSFSYAQIRRLSKVRAGMRKSEVLGLFGAPIDVQRINLDRQVFIYEGKMCSDRFDEGYEAGTCGLVFDNGHVGNIENFSFKYTDDLK
jgi:hypothetical protein